MREEDETWEYDRRPERANRAEEKQRTRRTEQKQIQTREVRSGDGKAHTKPDRDRRC